MRHTHITSRIGSVVLGVALLVAGCGGGEMSLTEYVERIDDIHKRAIAQYEALITRAEGEVLVVGQGPHLGFEGDRMQLTDFTPQDLQMALERVVEIQAEALEAAAAIEPPSQVADLHNLYFRELPMKALAARAGTASSWEELSDTPEMAAYRTGLAGDQQVCEEFQAKLDATAERGVFADTPWIPGDLKEIVEYAIGCGSLPEHPEDVYRPSPTNP